VFSVLRLLSSLVGSVNAAEGGGVEEGVELEVYG
jgi:hypothetical protein